MPRVRAGGPRVQRVIEERRVALQRYILELASISVPNPVGDSFGLIRIRELDDFLEVPVHVCGPGVALLSPTLSNSANLYSGAFDFDSHSVTSLLRCEDDDCVTDIGLGAGASAGSSGTASHRTVSAGTNRGRGGGVSGHRGPNRPLPVISDGGWDDVTTSIGTNSLSGRGGGGSGGSTTGSVTGQDAKGEVQLRVRDRPKRDVASPPTARVSNLHAEAAFPSTLPSRTRALYDFVVEVSDMRGTCVEAKAVAGFIRECTGGCDHR